MTTAASEELAAMGVAELDRAYASNSVSPVEVVQAVIERAERLNPTLHAYIAITADAALRDAKTLERAQSKQIERGPLHGVPVSIKDNIDVRGIPTTAASRVLMNAEPAAADAAVVKALRDAGAVIVGKNNLYEFAAAYSDPSSTPFGIVENPRRIGHQAGGSSNGSAAAVAAGLGVISIGTDAGGSVRHPASACGAVGFIPSPGILSREGVLPTSHTLGRAGFIARTVGDVLAAFDAASPVTASRGSSPDVEADATHLRIGVPASPIAFASQRALLLFEEVKRILIDDLELSPVEVELPDHEELYETLETIALYETALHHNAYGGRANLYGEPLRQELEAARTITTARYAAALHARDVQRAQWERQTDATDLVLLPSNRAPSPPHNVTHIDLDGTATPTRIVNSAFNRPANLFGLPAIALPVGLAESDLPVAIQLVAEAGRDSTLLTVADRLEGALGAPVLTWGIEVNTPKESPYMEGEEHA